jgi:hypothetical protein
MHFGRVSAWRNDFNCHRDIIQRRARTETIAERALPFISQNVLSLYHMELVLERNVRARMRSRLPDTVPTRSPNKTLAILHKNAPPRALCHDMAAKLGKHAYQGNLRPAHIFVQYPLPRPQYSQNREHSNGWLHFFHFY